MQYVRGLDSGVVGQDDLGLEKQVVVVGLYDIVSDPAVEWNLLMASVVVAIILIILFT